MWGLVLGGLLVALLWALSPVLYKVVLTDLSPSMLLVIGTWAAAAVVTLFAVHQRAALAHEWGRITWTHAGIVVLTAVTGTLAANLVFYALLRSHASGPVTALASCAPIVTALLAYVFLRERLGWEAVAGVVLMVAGVLLVALRSGPGAAHA